MSVVLIHGITVEGAPSQEEAQKRAWLYLDGVEARHRDKYHKTKREVKWSGRQTGKGWSLRAELYGWPIEPPRGKFILLAHQFGLYRYLQVDTGMLVGVSWD